MIFKDFIIFLTFIYKTYFVQMNSYQKSSLMQVDRDFPTISFVQCKSMVFLLLNFLPDSFLNFFGAVFLCALLHNWPAVISHGNNVLCSSLIFPSGGAWEPWMSVVPSQFVQTLHLNPTMRTSHMRHMRTLYSNICESPETVRNSSVSQSSEAIGL